MKIYLYKKNPKGEFTPLFQKIPDFDWCKLMKGSSKMASNIFAKLFLGVSKAVFPQFSQNCPIQPMIVEVKNRTLPYMVVNIFPMGVYKINLLWFHKTKERLLNVTLSGRIFEV